MMRAIHLRGVGMATPVGLTATTTCAAIRAGIDRTRELPYVGNDNNPLSGSRLSELNMELSRRQRWLTLLVTALRDLLAEHPRALLERVPLLLAIPRDSDGTEVKAAELAYELSAALEVRIQPTQIITIFEGSFGGYYGLSLARQRMQAGETNVIVAAADSLIEARALAALDRQRQLLRTDNADGVIPGEAAACVLLNVGPASALASLRGIGLAKEAGRRDNDVPLRGNGIAHAAKQALSEAVLRMHDLNFRAADAAGDAYAFKEQVLAVSKLLRRNMDDFPLLLPATALGFTGAAAGMCALVYVAVAMASGHAPGPRAIVYASAESGNRAAVIVESSRMRGNDG